jgi:hypothetical protein
MSLNSNKGFLFKPCHFILSVLEILGCLLQSFRALAKVMAMGKSPIAEILDMGDVFPLEVLMENHLKVAIVRMGGERADCNWFVEHGCIMV